MDLDFLYRSTQEHAREELATATGLDLVDYFAFVVAPGTRILEEGGRSTRYRITSYIGRVPYLMFSVDVGVLDPLRLTADQVIVPDLFVDLGFGALTVPVLPIPHQIAEKVHAITRMTKAGTPRTRVVKDLADLVLISTTEHLSADDVRTAIHAVFHAYNTHPLPPIMPATPTEWGRDYREAASELRIPSDLAVADAMVGEFLNEVLVTTAHGVWDPISRKWWVPAVPERRRQVVKRRPRTEKSS